MIRFVLVASEDIILKAKKHGIFYFAIREFVLSRDVIYLLVPSSLTILFLRFCDPEFCVCSRRKKFTQSLNIRIKMRDLCHMRHICCVFIFAYYMLWKQFVSTFWLFCCLYHNFVKQMYTSFEFAARYFGEAWMKYIKNIS